MHATLKTGNARCASETQGRVAVLGVVPCPSFWRKYAGGGPEALRDGGSAPLRAPAKTL